MMTFNSRGHDEKDTTANLLGADAHLNTSGAPCVDEESAMCHTEPSSNDSSSGRHFTAVSWSVALVAVFALCFVFAREGNLAQSPLLKGSVTMQDGQGGRQQLIAGASKNSRILLEPESNWNPSAAPEAAPEAEHSESDKPAPKVGVSVVDPSKPTTLFCFSMVLTEGVERWLMSIQWHRGTGIFGCHKYQLLSDGNLTLTSYTLAPLQAVSLPGDKAWFAPQRNVDGGVWHNTNVFVRAWNWLNKMQEYKDYDWTVKVDPDCVFMPGKLQSLLNARNYDASQPIYLENCAQWGGIQGPLEVFSKAGTQKFFEGLPNCQAWTDWKQWGEDWFVGKCMNILGVQAQNGFNTLDDMWCKVDWNGSGHNYEDEVKMNGPRCDDGKAAFHPYKTTKDMRKCIAQAMTMPVGVPTPMW